MNCLDTAAVIGKSRDPVPPARMIPLRLVICALVLWSIRIGMVPFGYLRNGLTDPCMVSQPFGWKSHGHRATGGFSSSRHPFRQFGQSTIEAGAPVRPPHPEIPFDRRTVKPRIGRASGGGRVVGGWNVMHQHRAARAVEYLAGEPGP